jgi:hypothetical protein
MLSSGDFDDWDDIDNVKMEMDLGGALLIYKKSVHTVTAEEAEEYKRESRQRLSNRDASPVLHEEGEIVEIDAIVAVYAPGMWMKFEVDQ